jgi:fucose 4-O-acetylase-like acetyltransferase
LSTDGDGDDVRRAIGAPARAITQHEGLGPRPFSELDDSGSGRAAWVDVLRGAAIVLVILFHVITVTTGYTGHVFARAEDFLAAVQGLRMPMLFFLSGLLVDRSLRKGRARYLDGKLARIAYPYFVWSALMVVVYAVGQRTLGWDVDLLDMVGRVFFSPIDHLWFLAYLFIYFVLALLLQHIPFYSVVAVALALYAVPVEGQWEVFWRFAVYFFAGALAGSLPRLMDALTASTWLNLAAIAVVGTLTVLEAVGIPLRLASAPWNVVLGVWLFLGLSGVVALWARARPLRPLAFVGRHSLVFYLVHWPVVLVSIRLLAATSEFEPWAVAAIALLITAVITTVAAILAERTRWARWLFEMPQAWRARLR